MTRLALLPLVAILATPAAADPGATDRMRAAITNPLGIAGPGCAVGIYRGGKLAETVSTGAADVATGRAIGPNTQFYAASVAKQFTAIAVMQLVAAGKVSLDDDIHKYVPELPPYPNKVTLLMLLNMTSGIRDSLSLLNLEGYTKISEPTRAMGMAAVVRQTETKFVPGTRYDYTNGGYLLLSEVVERVAKQPFESYMNDKVLKPLGMTRSFVMLGNRPTDPDVARGYVVGSGPPTLSDEYPLFGGSGGLVTTITDLAKWDHDIDTGHKVWTPEITKWMTTPGKFNNGAPVVRSGRGIAYGSALMIGPNWYQHSGGASGFKTYYARNPAKRIGIGLLCNNGDYDPGEKADAVIAALNEGLPQVTQPSSNGSAINGRYRTAGLASTYLLAAKDDMMTVSIEQPGGQIRPPVTIKRNDQGEYRTGVMTILPDDDARGFTLTIPRVTLHFDKVQ